MKDEGCTVEDERVYDADLDQELIDLGYQVAERESKIKNVEWARLDRIDPE